MPSIISASLTDSILPLFCELLKRIDTISWVANRNRLGDRVWFDRLDEVAVFPIGWAMGEQPSA